MGGERAAVPQLRGGDGPPHPPSGGGGGHGGGGALHPGEKVLTVLLLTTQVLTVTVRIYNFQINLRK